MPDAAASRRSLPRVVIVGGGFGGLYAAKALRGAHVDVTLIDRRNHHTFQPLLYQVATAGLSPADIAQPLRGILERQRNCGTVMAEATGFDLDRRAVLVTESDGDEREIPYDYLVVAAGATDSYFGHDEWREHAPPLKSLEDAITLRRRFLIRFEQAETEPDVDVRRALLTFVIVGAGPTGVELAGTMMEIARNSAPRVYRTIDPREARVVLVEGEGRVLPAMSEESSRSAQRQLERLGVEVVLGQLATAIDAEGVTLKNGTRIECRFAAWAAGVRASPLIEALGVETDKAGRAIVEPDCSLPGRPEVFVVGDAAKMIDANTGEPTPGVAQGAIQSGRFVARIITKEAGGAREARPAFRYRDKGTMATIGRAAAVVEIAGRKFGGALAWLLWLGVHLVFLIGFRNKLLVMIQWAWAYVFYKRGAALITGERSSEQ
ncbi:MAG: NAD(P)/FAD-dependent oxidoreductase [Phycisphaerales bacterium]